MLRKLKYILPVAMVFLSSCKKDFLNINADPNNPTAVEVSKVLPNAERSLGDALALGENAGGLSEILAVYTHQMTTREEADQYGTAPDDFYLNLAWGKLYGTQPPPGAAQPVFGVLNNLEDIIRNGTAKGNLRFAGIAKILKAYTLSQLVDVFGDVPYSEANKLKEGIVYPKFDDDAAIYDAVLKLLDEGIADVNNTTAANGLLPGSSDIIYGGSADKWTRAANTIKLKLYTQMRKVKNVAADVTSLLNSGKLISQVSESFLIPYGTNGATDDRNPGFDTYYATQRSNHVSPWFYEILKGYNTRILTNNPDPRIPYYIYNQVTATQPPREGNQTEYRDGPFVSIYFGSVGPDRDRSQQNTISMFGIYPVGGKYDDGSATIATGSSGTGAAPYRMLTYADRLYLEAELIQAGVISGDAKAKFTDAMKESFRQVDYVITQFVKPTQSVPAIYNVAANSSMNTYIDKVLAEYDAASAAKKLELIMTEKWISSVGSAVDQYTDIRRTGYPIVFNPKDPTMAPGGRVQPPINGDPVNPGAQKSVPVQLSKSFPLTLFWPQSELQTNSSAPAQKTDLSTYKPFWMP